MFAEGTSTPPEISTDDGNRPANLPPAADGDSYLRCGFCKCTLTKRGQVYEMSPEAEVIRDEKVSHKKAIEANQEEISALRAQIVTLEAENASLKSSANASQKKANFL